ncbi:CheY-like superfamily [Penicillium fimorum]|uniref:CheY-like superfamily n=1 Tax=Penicillium fimorum TaxID=1882269 RepID=A0A9W9XKH9_9EURO|nr:CheY-like superfamily [Penicillium fimorum]
MTRARARSRESQRLGDSETKTENGNENETEVLIEILLIHQIANDCKLQLNIPNAGARICAMIEDILHYDGMEKTTIILSTLIPSSETRTAGNIPAANEQYRNLVTVMRKEGVSIVLAEMNPHSSVIAHNLPSWPLDYTTNGKADTMNPNDCDYRTIARIWYDAIGDANDQDLIVKAGVMAAEESCEDGSCDRAGVLALDQGG